MSDKSIPELSLESRLLADALRKVPKGETITYESLSEIVGRDVREWCKGALYTARKRVLNDDQIVTEAVSKVGIKVLQDVEVVGSAGESARRRIRRCSRVAARKLTSVAYGELPNNLRIKHNTELSLLSVIAQFSTESSAKRLAGKINEDAALPFAKTLEFFKD